MINIKKIFSHLSKIYIKTCAVVCFIFFIVVVCLIWLEQDFWDIDSCLDQGLVWDYDQRICRNDCLTWNKADGCVPITEENRKKKAKQIPF